MRCFLPFVDELSPAAARLLRIAQSIGADCVPVRLPKGSGDPVGDLENAVSEKSACIAICPAVVRAWLGTDRFPASLASCLLTRFRFLLVHELDTDPGSANVLRELSQGAFSGVCSVDNAASNYQVAAEELCGAFSGLNFGPVNAADRVLGAKPGGSPFDPIVSIGAEPMFARIRVGPAEVFFSAGAAEIDLEGDVTESKLAEYFSGLLPAAMFLRHAFQHECWRPATPPHACLTVDDPPLWKAYGFVDYEQLLSLMDEFRFHTTIAFIPYYWRKSSPAIVRLFRQRPDRLSICFHGNDHTREEFVTQDSRRLNYLLSTARARMRSHERLTGMSCDNVMVFPHCHFSRNALQALKEHNFIGHVNSGLEPRGEHVPMSVLELMQPSIPAFNGFPFFLRRSANKFRPEDVAFDAFFGRPILIEEHHEVFKDPEPLLDLVSTINRIVPQVQWRNLQTSLENACLIRRPGDGAVVEARPAAMAGRITNPGGSPLRCAAEWRAPGIFEAGSSISIDGAMFSGLGDDTGIRVLFEVGPGDSRIASVQYNPTHDSSSFPKPSFGYTVGVHLRRRASELRDNVLSKSPAAMSLVKLARNAFLGQLRFQ